MYIVRLSIFGREKSANLDKFLNNIIMIGNDSHTFTLSHSEDSCGTSNLCKAALDLKSSLLNILRCEQEKITMM